MECIIIGMGPSFLEWLKQPIPDDIILFGTGRSTQYNLDLDAYFYACPPKREFLPKDGTDIYAREEVWEEGMIKWDNFLPRGGSAGGMMISFAANNFDRIGVIGFDGFGMPDYFISDIRGLFRYWMFRGKKFYSLMPESSFDDLLIHEN